MALVVRCVGIDRFADAEIQDLTGAARDATALHALLVDTLDAPSAELLVDAAATGAAMRAAMVETLAAAGPDDDLVLFYAGHGTRDHRLVAHDSPAARLEESTVSMADIADAFRTTRARTALVVLDCCFSGDAAARVFAEPLASRASGAALPAIEGEGRFLLSASSPHEPAYEHPIRRHGLLTDALLQVFTRNVDARIDLTTAMAEVRQIVQAEAAALGYSQTPALVGHLAGGYSLPALRRGARFHAAFPELQRPTLTGPIAELAGYGIPTNVLERWAEAYPAGLNALQCDAANQLGVLAGDSALIIAPTSAGKTLVGELAAIRAVVDGRKAVFLLPYKALVNEKFEDFAALYGTSLRLRVIRCTGDFSDERSAFVRGKYDIAVLTYEMFLALAITQVTTLPRIGLVVLDEAQFITDPGRGITVELLLTQLRAARAKGIAPQLLALSATIDGLNHFDEWLSLRMLRTDTRPVPLEFGVLDRSGVYQYRAADGQTGERQLLPRHAIQQRKAKPSSQDVIVPLVQHLLADNVAREKVLVFRNKRGPVEGCAKYIAAACGLPSAVEVVDALPATETTLTSAALRAALSGGVALHTSNLAREERVAVERAFRDKDSRVRVLVATSGVAAGVNTPASTVIIAEHTVAGTEPRPYSVSEVQNMAGRAGRQGYQETGRAIMLAEHALERTRLFRAYVTAPPEPLRSSFASADLGTWIVRLFAQVPRVPAESVGALLAQTFGGYLLERRDPGEAKRIRGAIDALIARMHEQGLLEADDSGAVQLTLLGRVCARSAMKLESALRLVATIRRLVGQTHAVDLLALVQALPEMDRVYTPLVRGQSESHWVANTATLYGRTVASALQAFASEPTVYWKRAKRACLLAAWIAGEAAPIMERRFSHNPYVAVGLGDIVRTADATRMYIQSAADIMQLVQPDTAPPADHIAMLLRRLELGIPAELLDLMLPGLPLSRGQYLALGAARLGRPELIAAASADTLRGVVGGLAEALQAAATRIASTAREPAVAKLSVGDQFVGDTPPALTAGHASVPFG